MFDTIVMVTTFMEHDEMCRITSGCDVYYISRCLKNVLVKNHQHCVEGVSDQGRDQVTEFVVINFVYQIVIKPLKNALIVRCVVERQVVLNIVR